MKKLLLIITLFISLAAQAQTYSPFLKSGDTITIRQGENYLAATNDGLQRYTIANDNCLWKITITKGTTTIGSSAYYYTLQNIATKTFIQIDAGYRWSAYANISLGPTAATFYLNRKGGENGNYSQGGLLYRYVRSNNRTYDFYLTYNNGWTMQQGTTADLYLEKWTRKEVQAIDGYFTPRKHEFNLAKTDAEAEEQVLNNVRYVFDLRDSAYLYCKNRPTAPKLQQTVDVKTDLNILKAAPYNITPTFKWESTDNVNSQLDPEKFAATDIDETTRNLLSVTSTGNISSDGLAYELSITPVGPSPKGLKNPLRGDNTDLIWVDYVDRLVATCTYKGKEYTSTMRVVRKSYHKEELPQFEFTLSPSTYTFTATDNLTQYFTINCTHQHGEVWYNIDEQKVDIETSYDPAPVQLPTYSGTPSGQFISWSDAEKTVTLSLKELNSDNSATWLSFTAISGNTITLTAQPNNANNSTYRQAQLVGEITYNKLFDQTVHSHTGSFSRIIAQRSNSGNYITFAHSKGYPYDGDKPTEVAIINGSHADEQKVHTAEKIIYHLSGEPVELRLPENNFFGYMRWYDYETGCNPRYNPNPHEQLTWALVPRANGTNFLEINTATGQSHGLYATAAEGLSRDNRNNNTPIINAGTKNNVDTIACDVSAYTDYNITYENGQKDKIVEPTLSYRQLFILRPASEIANKLKQTEEHKFLEDYRYQAPIGRNVLLATQHRHSNYRYHISEMCYFYYDKNEQIKRVNAESGGTKLTWYVKDGDCSEQHDLDGFTVLSPNYPAEIDYQQVESDVKGTKTYRLMAMTNDNSDLAYNLHIAQFVVEYVDIHTHGPSTTELISDNEITQNYISLTKVDFNKTKPTSSNTEYLSTPLPWQDATYGFTYPGAKPTYNRHVNNTFPFYGEYCFVNKINTQTQNWLKAETNRGGAANGFAMYVDGTMEPGIVATISTKATICSGQTLYCSAWFCNPATEANKTRPIFRCNVQGRKMDVDGTWLDWEDAGVYFVGEIQNTGWQQIMFPINSAQSYDETRVMIYNFATNNQGNDFMIDDINLFVSPLPIAAYQGKMACRSMSSDVATSAAVLRLDYSNLTEDEDKYIYYQIFNDSEDKAMVFEGEGVTYFHENETDHNQNNTVNRYGSVSIPSGDFNPETDNTEKDYIRPSLSKFLDYMVDNNVVNGKCYVKTTNYGVTKWLLYVVHLIPNEAPYNDQAATIENDEYDTSEKLKTNKEYTMRMAHTPAELDKPSCNMQTSLTAVHQTMFQLRNPSGDVGESFYATSHNNCANELYMLDVEISNAYAERLGSGSGAIVTGLVYADWLKGFDFDAVYADKSLASDEALSNANSAFETQYGHKRGDVATAILYDMRRVPSASEPNPNYYAKSFEELQPEAFLSHKNYDIVKDLYEKGYLQFYQTTDTFYLASEDVARFWVYPISETAKATVQYTANGTQRDTTLVLHDCPEPRWVEVSSAYSAINLNITQYTQDQLKDEGLNHQLPRIKVVANQTTPVSISVNQKVYSIDGTAELFSTNDPQCTNKSQVTATVKKDAANTLQITPTGTYSLRPGFEYIMYVHAGTENSCTSKLYFTLVVVPEVVIWKPKSNTYNGWGMDANWKGWVDDGDGIVEDTELIKGYVPIQGVNVVIPSMEHDLRYPSVTDHHHHPMDLNASSSTCENIYFEPGAKIHNQHLLQYKNAFVDMQMTAGSWHLVSAPLQGMVSGDMFIPHNGWYSESQHNRIAEPNPFDVSEFQGIRHADAAYAFWEAFHESDVDGSNTLVRNFSNMKFTQSNSLIQPLHIGKGYMVYGLGHQEAEQLTVRLPKPDTKYYYYNEGNKDESSYVDITQTNRGKLAYTADHTNENMTIRLTKQPNSNYVVFGNPTMAYIDLLALYNDNKDKGWTGEYTYVQHSATAARTPMFNTPDRYLPPMTSVLLTTTNEATELTIHLEPEHLTLNTEVDRSMNSETPSQLAARRAPVSDNEVSELMTINAFTEKAFASMILATNPVANDYYTSGEDALFTSTGVENESYVTTPLNMYTVAEQVPMMADVRQGISDIPLAILAADKARAEHMQLAFYLSSNWTRECYFCDTKTGQKIRIMDGLVITVEMPQNHEQRYFIEGPDEYLGSSEDPQGPTTAVDNTSSSALATLQPFSLAQGELTIGSNQLIQEIRLYDLAGRLILDNSLTLLHTTTTVTAPSGICLVEAVLRDGTTLHTQALVK